MIALPLGTLPPFEEFERAARALSVTGTYDLVLRRDEAIIFVTGAINQGFEDLESIGCVGRWKSKHTVLELHISDPYSLYVLVSRLVDMERTVELDRSYEATPGGIAKGILETLGYAWEENDGESEEGEEGLEGTVGFSPEATPVRPPSETEGTDPSGGVGPL